MRVKHVEHTVPGYDTAKADFRDRGLRLSRAHVRPLIAKDLPAKGPFLPSTLAAPEPLTYDVHVHRRVPVGRDVEDRASTRG